MRKLFTLCLLIVSLSASAQWQQTGSKVRYVNGLGIPTRDTAAGVLADSSQILIRPADSSLYVKYKRTWMRVGGGGGSIAGSGTTNYIPKFTSSTAIGNSQIFDNGTNVGIGETSPNGKLDVRSATGHVGINTGTSVSPERGNLYYTTDGTGWKFNIGKLQSGTFTPQMTFQDNGSVGIGTTSPTTISGYVGTTTNGTSGSWHILAMGGTNKSIFETGGSVTQLKTLVSEPLTFGTNNAERMRITAAGDVGIGTTSPSAKLDVVGGNILGGDGTVKTGISYAGTLGILGTLSNHNLGVFTNSLERMRITSAGNTLIGTTTDNGTDRLQVSGSASVTSSLGIGTSPSVGALHIKTTTPRIVVDDNDNSGTASLWFRPQSASFAIKGSIELISTGSAAPTRFVIASTDTMTFRTNNVERMRITSAGGNVLISTTTDNNTDKLQVNGSIQGTGFNQAYTARTTTYTATTSDYFIDCTTGTFTVNLLTAVGNTGRILIIKNSGTGTITVDPNGSQTIDGATTQTLSTQWSRVHIISDGANWKIISN